MTRNINTINSETSYIRDEIAPNCNFNKIVNLKKLYIESPQKRHCFCFHQDPMVDMHDIIICFDKNYYQPPKKHIGKCKSLIVLEGKIEFFLFNDNGEVFHKYILGNHDSGFPFYIRIPPNTWHGLRAISEGPVILKETLSGPYNPKSFKLANFAPSEHDGIKLGNIWYENISNSIKINLILNYDFFNISEYVFTTTSHICVLDKDSLAFLNNIAKKNSLGRARVNCHYDSNEHLQEMFIVLAKNTYIEESFHINKDESLIVLNGVGEYNFPDENNGIRKVIKLEPYSDRNQHSSFFTRINRFVPHRIIIKSDFFLMHESTTGPFYKSDTSFRIHSTL